MTKELRYVFDDEILSNNAEAKSLAVKHLQAMPEPRAWVHDQISFDKELVEAKKISQKECTRRLDRWTDLLGSLAD